MSGQDWRMLVAPVPYRRILLSSAAWCLVFTLLGVVPIMLATT